MLYAGLKNAVALGQREEHMTDLTSAERVTSVHHDTGVNFIILKGNQQYKQPEREKLRKLRRSNIKVKVFPLLNMFVFN